MQQNMLGAAQLESSSAKRGPGNPAGHQVELAQASMPCSKDREWYPGLP